VYVEKTSKVQGLGLINRKTIWLTGMHYRSSEYEDGGDEQKTEKNGDVF
jgi:hypothetical protein